MSYLNVEGIYKKLLEDSHIRLVQRNKVISSNIRNDRVAGSKVISPNMLGSFKTIEDRLEAVLMAGTINQNNEQLRMNRLALKRGMEHAIKNPKLIPGYILQDKTKLHPKSAAAIAYPYQNAIATNANYDPTSHQVFHDKKLNIDPTPELIRSVISALMQHEQSHILFINWIEEKYGKKMRREIALRSEEATYKYSEAIANYATSLQQNGFDPNNPDVIQAKKVLDFASKLYSSDPLEQIAAIIECDVILNNNIDALNSNLSLFKQIIAKAVKDIKSGRR